MNPQNILEQFLGTDVVKTAGGAVQSAKGSAASSGLAGIAGGAAAGGLLGLLLGNKKARKKVGKFAGGVAGYGGAAALGALAYSAYRNWQAGQQTPQSAPTSQAAAYSARAEVSIPPEQPPAGSTALNRSAIDFWRSIESY